MRAAKNYLEYTAFSRKGLIEQLEYDDFSTEDATFAVDHITVDWNEEGSEVCEKLISTTQPSPVAGLIEQLEYYGFTPLG